MADVLDDEPKVWHVVPLGDLKEHEDSPDCWCEPVLAPEAEDLVYVHHSLDGRERMVH